MSHQGTPGRLLVAHVEPDGTPVRRRRAMPAREHVETALDRLPAELGAEIPGAAGHEELHGTIMLCAAPSGRWRAVTSSPTIRIVEKREDPAPAYPCMMPPAHLRRVLDPHDERRVARRGLVRRALARLAAAVRT